MAFLFGVWAGAAMSFWMMARHSPPGWIERWQQGAYGEQATAKQLRELGREGWVVLHDLPGPGGVFVLDSKRIDGHVRVDNGTVTVARIDDPALQYVHTGTHHLRRLARETNDRVLGVRRIATWVTPILVWWADFP